MGVGERDRERERERHGVGVREGEGKKVRKRDRNDVVCAGWLTPNAYVQMHCVSTVGRPNFLNLYMHVVVTNARSILFLLGDKQDKIVGED